ncbi:hypothetical protein Dsin_024527 [Dipteronia sinensis]|uniref:Reverse transcriptase domain-containing protein n=1 Tax=Dipteronia sinensis TaxID=43782 RepID=A0AAE0DW45_9ROSI|nr:hypothetical protein Dsin_024527 [Dipteronia sinensis]
MVDECFMKGCVPGELNKTFISLIPKIPSPTNMTQFRPISLCNTTYKILSKIIVQRIKPLLPNLVSPSQVLEEVGIVGRLNNLIMSCVSSAQYKVILNGELTESFHPRSGIRQGDHLSPYIFVLCMEKLSHIINQKLAEGAWKTVKVSRRGRGISHLFFTDDLILFGQASVDQVETIRECLDTFCDLWANSRITKSTYKDILEKSQKRLASWKSASLSIAGRCMLIKSVALALPIYAMQSIKISTEICSKLDKLNRDFLWGNDSDTKKIAPNYLKINNCSSNWRGFLFGAELLLKGMSWRVGNGENIGFWTDEWVPGFGKLATFVTSSMSNDRMNEQVSEYLLPTGWNSPKQFDVLPCHVVQRILLSIHTDNILSGTDRAIWGLCNDDWWNANNDMDNVAELKSCFITWNPPTQEWVKLDVDGSMNPVLGSIAACGVIRDHKKNWLGGFALNKGTGSVIEAELLGIFEGMKLVWKEGHKNVVVESDS